MELKFVMNRYFKQLFQYLRPKLQYSKNRIFVISHFGTPFVHDSQPLSTNYYFAPPPAKMEVPELELDSL